MSAVSEERFASACEVDDVTSMLRVCWESIRRACSRIVVRVQCKALQV